LFPLEIKVSENQTEDSTNLPDELTALKQRADLLGVSYHPSIGVDKLREKVNAAVTGENLKEEEKAEAAVVVQETEAAKRLRLRNEAAKLVRIRLTCMNPNKKEWDGEIITAGNAGVGTYKKFIPFNAEEGWHVPHIIYQQLLHRECQIFVTVKDARGNKIRKGKMIREFAIEVLPQLTQEELDDLARQQAMSKAID
jgi:hypothetical protein